MKKILLLLAASLMLYSCIDLETELSLNANGSGSLNLVYKVSSLAADLESQADYLDFNILPLSRTDFDARASKIKGVKLVSWKETKLASETVINCRLTFDNTAALDEFLFPGKRGKVNLDKKGRDNTFSIELFQGNRDGLSPEGRDFISKIFSENSFSWTFNAPSSIDKVSLGTVKGSRAAYSLTLLQLLESREKIVWEISWKQ